MSEAITKALQDVIAAHDHGRAIMGEQMRDAGVTSLTIGGPNGDAALKMFEAISAARAALSQPTRHLTVTTTESGEAVMVSWQDDEHRILDVVWERKAQPAPLAAYAPNDTPPPKGDSVTKEALPTQSGKYGSPGLQPPLAGEVTDGELNPRRAYEFGQLITKYSDSFNDQDWGGINESVDRKNLAVALDHLTQAGGMLMNVSERLEQTNRAILDLRPAVEPMTPEQQPNPFSKRCYTMSESHLSGYRLIVGFERLEDAQDAHTFVANVGRHHGITAKAEGGA